MSLEFKGISKANKDHIKPPVSMCEKCHLNFSCQVLALAWGTLALLKETAFCQCQEQS